MAKADLLAEAAELGIEFPGDEVPTNKQIQAAIDEAKAPEVVAEEPEPDAPAEEEVVDEEVPEEPSEPVFSIGQLKPYAEQLFGVGYHVLVGAQTAGCFPSGKVTKAEVAAGIEQYLNTPVEQPKEGE